MSTVFPFSFLVLVLFTACCFVTAFFSWKLPLEMLVERKPVTAVVLLAATGGFVLGAASEMGLFWQLSAAPASVLTVLVGLVLSASLGGASAVALQLLYGTLEQGARALRSRAVFRRWFGV